MTWAPRFYKSVLCPVLRRINEDLPRWAMPKYKRLRDHLLRAVRRMRNVARREPALFAHRRLARP